MKEIKSVTIKWGLEKVKRRHLVKVVMPEDKHG